MEFGSTRLRVTRAVRGVLKHVPACRERSQSVLRARSAGGRAVGGRAAGESVGDASVGAGREESNRSDR